MNPAQPKFALIAHPTDLALFRAYINHLKPGKTFRDELILKLFEWTPSYKVTDWHDVTLDGKTSVDGALFMVPFLPEMRDIKLNAVIKKVESAIALAASQGCAVAALGAFTSIVLQGREEEISRRHNITLTSGNTTTAAIIVRSVEELAARQCRHLENETVAVVGASGDIGTGITLWLGSKVKKLVLTARNIDILKQMVARHSQGLSCEIELSADTGTAIKRAGISVFVTSAYTTLCSENDFPINAIVCDASAPLNVQTTAAPRTDITLFHGGIAKLPCRLDPGIDIGLASLNHLYGCMTEGILMAFNPALPASLGRGNITKLRIEQYQAELEKYRIGPAYSHGKKILFDQ